VTGIALVQLLIIGVDLALLWRNQAEVAGARLSVGMKYLEARETLWLAGGYLPKRLLRRKDEWKKRQSGVQEWKFSDGSAMRVAYETDWSVDDSMTGVSTTVTSVFAIPPPSVHPLTRLRRTLARIFPALDDSPRSTTPLPGYMTPRPRLSGS
jgi:hypothetical protein